MSIQELIQKATDRWNLIRNETLSRKNTATRVGEGGQYIIDCITWLKDAIAGFKPWDPKTLFFNWETPYIDKGDAPIDSNIEGFQYNSEIDTYFSLDKYKLGYMKFNSDLRNVDLNNVDKEGFFMMQRQPGKNYPAQIENLPGNLPCILIVSAIQYGSARLQQQLLTDNGMFYRSRSGSTWGEWNVYKWTDSSLKQDKLTAGEGIEINGNTISAIPEPIPEQNVIDVTNMFSWNGTADISFFLFRRNSQSLKPLIKLHAYDSTQGTSDLTIIPEIGFGSQYTERRAVIDTPDGLTYNNYTITLNQEMGDVKGSIIVPYGVKSLDLNYHVSDGTNIPSYYVNYQGVMYPFDIINTPIDNFCEISGFVTINGEEIGKTEIHEICFGSGYSELTTIPSYFLNNFNAIRKVIISGFTSVTSLGSSFLSGLQFLNEVNFMPLKNVNSIGENFLDGCANINNIDLSMLNNVLTLRLNSLQSLYSLKTLKLPESLQAVGNEVLSYNGLTSVDFGNIGLQNIYAVGAYFFGSSNNLINVNISESELNSIDSNFMADCPYLTEINISGIKPDATIGSSFFENAIRLTSINIGSLDWTNITVGNNGFRGCRNDNECVIYAQSGELAEIFRSKMNGNLSNWSISII